MQAISILLIIVVPSILAASDSTITQIEYSKDRAECIQLITKYKLETVAGGVVGTDLSLSRVTSIEFSVIQHRAKTTTVRTRIAKLDVAIQIPHLDSPPLWNSGRICHFEGEDKILPSARYFRTSKGLWAVLYNGASFKVISISRDGKLEQIELLEAIKQDEQLEDAIGSSFAMNDVHWSYAVCAFCSARKNSKLSITRNRFNEIMVQDLYTTWEKLR